MYSQPKIIVYDTNALERIQALASSQQCFGGSIGVSCIGSNAATPSVSCTNGSVGVVTCQSGSVGVGTANP